jgi:cell division protease FtsH
VSKTEKPNKSVSSPQTADEASQLLAAAAKQEASEAAGFDLDAEEEQEEDAAPASPDPRPTAFAAIVGAAFEAAVGRDQRRRLQHGQALAAILVVPDTTWIGPAAAYAKHEYGSRWRLHMRDGKDRRSDASVGSDEVARDLSSGLCVMGVAADMKLLPAALQTAADIVIRIAIPNGAVLRRAIAKFARRSPGELEGGIGAGLDLHKMAAAFRPGTGARAIVRRLAASSGVASGSTERVPDLQTAIEFGDLRIWSLELARDVADPKVSWRDTSRGICCVSPPGFGKSIFPRMLKHLLERATGGSVALVSTSAGSWFANGPGYLDSVVKQWREAVSSAAAQASPIALLHIDEVEAAVPNRGTMSDRAREWWNTLVGDVLNLLDSSLAGRSSDAKIVVIGSTNHIEQVDPALLRPGRLERVVEIKPLDLAGTANVLKFHLDGEIDGDLTAIAGMLLGSTPAEVMYAVRSARRIARNAGRPLMPDDLRAVAMPMETHPPKRLLRMAVHEAAHAVATMVLSAGTVDRIVLRASGPSGGRAVVTYSDEDLPTRATIEDRVTIALAARAAELQFTGAMSIGSGGSPDSDVGFATMHVAALHASFCVTGTPVYVGEGADLLHALAADPALRGRVAADLRRLERRAMRIVAANREAIRAVAERLAEKRFLNGTEVEGLVSGRLVEESGAGTRRTPTRRRSKTSP